MDIGRTYNLGRLPILDEGRLFDNNAALTLLNKIETLPNSE